MEMATTSTQFDFAVTEIRAGRAQAHALWTLLSSESERDGFALKPAAWEGQGEYQRVTFQDGRDCLVHIPFGKTLPKA